MYYSRDLHKAKPDAVKDFTDFMKLFNYFPFVHDTKHSKVASLLSDPENRSAILDVIASVITQLNYRDLLNREAFFAEALRFFHNVIQDKGYRIIHSEDLCPCMGPDNHVFMMVAGCQTHKLYERRVDAAYNLIRDIKPPVLKVVFSGAHPSPSGSATDNRGAVAITLDEAAEMKAYFVEKQRIDSGFPMSVNIRLVEEKKSTRTKENIAFFFENLHLQDSGNHVLIVSSLFHLPRLIEEAEEHIEAKHLCIDRLTVVGSEDFRLNTTSDNIGVSVVTKTSPIYGKVAMFELLNQLLKDTDVTELMSRH